MPARARKTVPHFGPRPHREHRSARGRDEDYHYKRDSNRHHAEKEERWARDIDRKLRKKERELGED